MMIMMVRRVVIATVVNVGDLDNVLLMMMITVTCVGDGSGAVSDDVSEV